MADFLMELGSYHFPIEAWTLLRGVFLLCVAGFCLFGIFVFVAAYVADFVVWVRSRGKKND